MLLNIVRCLPFQDAKSVSNVFVKLRFLILRKYFIPQFNSTLLHKIVDAEIFIFVSYNLHLFEKKSKI